MSIIPFEANLANVETYEDFVSLYIQLDEANSTISWYKADVLNTMVSRFGDKSLDQLSMDLGQPRSTISNYSRTAIAFPKDKRHEEVSFSLHFQASYADEFDETTRTFKSDDRFEVLDKAIDDGLSVRKLAETIKQSKEVFDYCDYCNQSGDVKMFIFYCPLERGMHKRMHLHKECFEEILGKIPGLKDGEQE